MEQRLSLVTLEVADLDAARRFEVAHSPSWTLAEDVSVVHDA